MPQAVTRRTITAEACVQSQVYGGKCVQSSQEQGRAPPPNTSAFQRYHSTIAPYSLFSHLRCIILAIDSLVENTL
jgi:hypothetical protein